MPNKRKPNYVKDLQGTGRSDRDKVNLPQGEVLEFLPAASRKLDRYAKSVWNGVGAYLVKHKIIQDLDLLAFEHFAILSGELAKAAQELRKYSSPQTVKYTNKAGHANEVVSPKIKLYQSLLKDWVAYAQQFGITPASRSKITMPDPGTGKQTTIFDLIETRKTN